MEIPASGDQTMELTGDKLKELTNAIEDEEDDDEVKYQWLIMSRYVSNPVHFPSAAIL